MEKKIEKELDVIPREGVERTVVSARFTALRELGDPERGS